MVYNSQKGGTFVNQNQFTVYAVKEIFPNRLRQARLMRGLSMEGLCNRLGKKLSRNAVAKYEKGEMMPNSTSLIALATALGVSIDYFFRPFSVSIVKIDFRKKSKLGETKQKSIKEQVKDRLERYLEVERILDIKPLPFPNFSKSEIKDEKDVLPIVHKIKEEWGIGNDGIGNLIEVLEENDIKVIELDEELTFDGLCGYVNDNAPIIVLNENFPIERKRFTALHELGHLVLNFPNDIERKRKERFCDIFASEMLVSCKVFFQKIGENRQDISLQELIGLQKQFGISIDALMYKACHTNVITENRYKGYNIKKHCYPLFKAETEESRYNDEHTNRYERLVYRALASELISISKASDFLGKPVGEIRKQLMLV